VGFRDENTSVGAFASLLATHAFLVEELERDLVAATRLPLTWLEVLIRLNEAPEGSMRMLDLARTTLLSKSGMTRLVDRMHEAGLVERRACETDRRVTYAAISDAGRAALQDALPLHIEGVERLIGGALTASEVRQLTSILRKILRANGQRLDAACDTAALGTEQPVAG
jgi:DNA-binding MarR family transcriptional regulator